MKLIFFSFFPSFKTTHTAAVRCFAHTFCFFFLNSILLLLFLFACSDRGTHASTHPLHSQAHSSLKTHTAPHTQHFEQACSHITLIQCQHVYILFTSEQCKRRARRRVLPLLLPTLLGTQCVFAEGTSPALQPPSKEEEMHTSHPRKFPFLTRILHSALAHFTSTLQQRQQESLGALQNSQHRPHTYKQLLFVFF